MHAGAAGGAFVYVIDGDDRIIHLSDNWLAFAEENQAGAACHPDRVINRSLWAFIDGAETAHLYETMIRRIRTEQAAMSFPFRCDSPDRRRYLALTLTPLDQARIEFTSRIIREESRDSVGLLEPDAARSDDMLTMCSICKKVKLEPPDDRWVEVEAAVNRLRLFERERLPQISHGLCRDCFDAEMAEVMKLRGARSTPPEEMQEARRGAMQKTDP